MSDAYGANVGDVDARGGSRALDAEAEIRKLAHTLGATPQQLSMVSAIPAADLRTLRAQVNEAMFRAGEPAFTRVAALAKRIPGAIAAKLTELALPPLLAARTCELLEPARAVDMVNRLSDRYLADVSAVMDPARSPAVLAAIPAERVITINAELVRRAEWIVIGAFVSHVSTAALRAAAASYTGEQLLRIAFVLDNLSKLDGIVHLLTDPQLDDMLGAAATAGLWDELGHLLEHLAPARVDRLAVRFAAAPDQVQARIRAAAASGEFEPAALALLVRT